MKHQPNKPEQTRTSASDASSHAMGSGNVGKQPDASTKHGSPHDRDMQHKSGAAKDHSGDSSRNQGGHKDR